jgi:hypothetical protein
MRTENYWEAQTRITPTPDKVCQVVLECGWHNAMERWGWLGERTLSMILERASKGLPQAGRRGRKPRSKRA